MNYTLLVVAQILGLLLIPLGLPGLWLQVLSLAGYGYATGFSTVGWGTIVFVAVMAGIAEVLEFTMGGRYTSRYGGSRRAAWGAVIGGLIGAIVGVPIFLIGGVIGAFIGSFVGATLMELSNDWRGGDWKPAVRVGWGALVGRLVATALKGMIGIAIAAFALLAAAT